MNRKSLKSVGKKIMRVAPWVLLGSGITVAIYFIYTKDDVIMKDLAPHIKEYMDGNTALIYDADKRMWNPCTVTFKE